MLWEGPLIVMVMLSRVTPSKFVYPSDSVREREAFKAVFAEGRRPPEAFKPSYTRQGLIRAPHAQGQAAVGRVDSTYLKI